MVTNNNTVNRNDGLARSNAAADENVDDHLNHRLHVNHLNQPYGNGFAPPPTSHPLLAPPLPPPKKAKMNQQQNQQQQHRYNNNDSTLFSPGPTHLRKGSSSSSKKPIPTTATASRSTTKRRTPPGAVSSSSSRKTSKRSALSAPAAVAVNPSQQNPYSTSRGLRHFSMKVCEKVEEKGTTTYNEVADELVRELKQAEEAINLAAAARGEAIPVEKKKTTKNKKKLLPNGKTKKNHDDKNIRRRVYDALNVLMAMDIITKDKKEITWRGLPGSRVRDDEDDATSAMNATVTNAADGSLYSGSSNDENTTPSSSSIRHHHHHHHRKVDGLSRRQRVQQLQEELAQRQDDIRAKRECLQELMVQNVCFQNLLGRNHAREIEHQRNRHRRCHHHPYQRSTMNDGEREANNNIINDNDNINININDHDGVKEFTGEKIPLPFIIVNTDSKAVVQCEMSCPARTDVSFDFSCPFEINDDNEILKRLGMNVTSKEALQRSLPPDLFAYANGKGLLRDIARV